MEPAIRQRSNQLNYVPSLFFTFIGNPRGYWFSSGSTDSPVFNPIEPNPEVNGHHEHQAKPLSKTVVQAKANTNPEQLSLPRD